jgi:nickel-type superoxide dismutase maturation protease
LVHRSLIRGLPHLVLWALGRRTRLRVRGPSMEPALPDGSFVLVDPRAYRARAPRAGEVVVARHPYVRDLRLVKRVAQEPCEGRVALVGDRAEQSTDSRDFGAVGLGDVLGRVVLKLSRDSLFGRVLPPPEASMIPFLLALSLGVTANNAQRVDVSTDVRALVAAENAFAKSVQANGMKQGFLAYLAPDAVLFRPGPVAGVEWMKTRPAPSGYLEWKPIFADASRSSDLGYTTGPWTYRAKGAKDQIGSWGDYITIWRKQPDGAWKVAFDGGVSHPAPKGAAKSTRSGAMTSGGRVLVRPSSDPDSARAEVATQETALANLATSQSLVTAYDRYAAPDLRMFREGSYPYVGLAEARDFLQATTTRPTWTPSQTSLSAATDMAYVIGSYHTTAEDGAYLRIWKRLPEGGWRIVLDLASPAPPSPRP